ncbi:MAG: hypothetical protein U1E25_04605 [Methylocystis sp.]
MELERVEPELVEYRAGLKQWIERRDLPLAIAIAFSTSGDWRPRAARSCKTLLQSGKPFLQSRDCQIAAKSLVAARRLFIWGEKSRLILLFPSALFFPLFERREGPVAEKNLIHLSIPFFGL